MAQPGELPLGIIARRLLSGGHGVFTWADTARDCYETTLRILQKAADWLAANEARPGFGGERVAALPREARAADP
mgnify:CR=1 FL=1